MIVLTLFVLFVLQQQADTAVGQASSVEDLAEIVFTDISAHKHGNDDVNKIAYLYIHYEDDLAKPDYKNEVVKKLFDSNSRMNCKLKERNIPYFPGPPETK